MTPTFVFRRHLWLVDLLYSYGPLNKEQIDKHWEKSSINDDRSKNIPRRTFIRMREAIFEIFGIEIACNKSRGNVYYIVGLDEIKNGTSIHYLLQLFSVSNLLQETQQIQSRILLENTPVAANHYLPIVVTALKNNFVLTISYQSYKMGQCYTFNIEPFCLRHYQQRMYVLARRCDNNNIRLYALDRMLSAECTQLTFILPKDFNAAEYFKNYVGAMLEEKPVEHIVLQANEFRSNYLRSLPLHHSQKETSNGVFEYDIVPTVDFIQEVKAMGSDVIITQPQWLAERIQKEAQHVIDAYRVLSPREQDQNK